MSEKILEVKDLWIEYKVVKPIGYRELAKKIIGRGDKDAKKNKKFTAVRGISFDVERGNCIGIVGANGSGKSTMLRAIAGIYKPDKGEIIKNCEKTALLSLGLGFQKKLSGRDNIRLSALALGFTEEEIEEKTEAIIEFAELTKFIDNPVKTYSSGMYSKLAFAINMMLRCDILLIDEVLSVGDIRFRKKSYKKLSEIIKDDQQTVMIVSHGDSKLRELCDKVLWLDKGKLVKYGDTNEVLDEYNEFMKK